MTQTLRTSRHQDDNSVIDYTPSSAVTGGYPANPGGGIIGYADRDIAANEKGALSLEGIRRYKKSGSSGPTFAVGDTIVYDSSAGLHVALSTDHDGDADYACAICVEAAGASQDFVLGIPLQCLDRYAVIRPFVYEFDGTGNTGDTDTHTLIPAYMNRHGLILKNVFGIVTEKPVGDTEDQMIVTVEDSDGTDICTLTTSATPDDIGDIIVANLSLCNDDSGDLSGTAWKTVAAGKGVQGLVTQQTDDASAANERGKLKVYCDFLPLL